MKCFFWISFFFLVSGCTKDKGYITRGNYPSEIDRIVSTNCAVTGCHTSQSSAAAGGVNLENWEALFRGSQNGSPVIPYNSRFSPLMYFINTYADLGLQSKPTMPLNKPPLSREEVMEIRNWIDNGAPDAGGKIKWAEDPGRNKLYVVNQGCDLVMVLDAATGLPMRAIEVGTSFSTDAPHQVRVSPDGQFWYVVYLNSNFMQKFRCSDDTYVGDIPLTPRAANLTTDPSQDALDWNAFVISADGKRAYCTSWTQSGKVSVVDLENMRFVRWLGGQYYPHGIALNAAGDKLYVTAQTGNFITELDTALSDSQLIPLEGSVNYSSSLDIHEAVLSPSGSELWVTCQGTDEVRVLDLHTRTVKAIIPTADYPQEMIYSKINGKYYVSCDGLNEKGEKQGVIMEIDAANFSARQINCGDDPHGIAINSLTNELYVLSRNIGSAGTPPHHGSVCNGKNGYVSFIDIHTFRVKPGTFELSVDPYFIFPRF